MKPFLLIIFSSLLGAETNTSSATCGPVTRNTSCQLGEASASVNYSFNISGGSITTRATGMAEGSSLYNSDALLDVSEQFIALGSGTGYVSAEGFLACGGRDGGGASVGIGLQLFAGFVCSSDGGGPISAVLIPIPLGTVLTIQASGLAGGAEGITPGSGLFDLTSEFDFFAADMVTPVRLEAVPEPTPTYLVLFGGLAALLMCRRGDTARLDNAAEGD